MFRDEILVSLMHYSLYHFDSSGYVTIFTYSFIYIFIYLFFTLTRSYQIRNYSITYHLAHIS